MKKTGSKVRSISILGAGWLGLPLGAALVEKGYTVKGSTTRPEKQDRIREAGISPYLIEIGSEEMAGRASGFFETDLLFVNIPPRRRDPDLANRYPARMQIVLEQIIKQEIPYCIFISSTGVYPDTNGLVDESLTLKPTSTSGRALLQAERIFRDPPILHTTILRLAGLVGGQRQPGRWLAGKKQLPNGEAPVNLVHRADCIAIIIQLIEGGIWNETFNICADEHPRRRDYYPQQAKKLGLEPPVFQPESGADFKLISNQKIKDRLGYTFTWPDPGDFPIEE